MKRLSITALAAMLMAPPTVAGDLSLGLSPMREEFRLAAGETVTRVLRLSNASKDAVRIRAEVLDFNIDDTLTPQFAKHLRSESIFSCRSWLRVNPMETDLEPESGLTVRYTLAVPPHTPEGGYHCAAGFRTLAFRPSHQPGTNIRSAVRVVAAFYVLVGEPIIDGSPTGLGLAYDPATERWQAILTIDNRGRRYFRPSGELQLLNEHEEPVETARIPPIPVLPRRKQRVPMLLEKVEAGRSYTLRLRIDLGGGEIIEGSRFAVAEVPPP